MSDYETMIISALRYALPRRSYIMSMTDEYITKMLKKKVSNNFLHVAIRDIEDHYDWEKSIGCNNDPIRYDWMPLLKRLNKKL
jgi:hypothetical protein